MEKATISELKNGLSGYLKKVRAGQTVLILDRDQPVARIERIEASSQADDPLARLERAGLVKRGKPAVSVKALRQEAPRSRQSVVRALLDERSESR